MVKLVFENHESHVELQGKLSDTEAELTCLVHDALASLAGARGCNVEEEVRKVTAALMLATKIKEGMK